MNGRIINKTPLEAWIVQKIGSSGQQLNKEMLAEYQLAKLQQTIDLAYSSSPFYRQHLQGYADKELTSLEDLARFPFTTPEILQAKALQLLCVSQDDVNRVVTLDSSGTTGEPKRIYFTKEDQELTIDFFQQGMSTLVEPREKVLILLPCQRPGGVGDLLFTALQRLDCLPIRHGAVRSLAETLKVLVSEEIDALVGIPVQVLALARYYQQHGHSKPLPLSKILLSTDYLSTAIRQELTGIWNCEVFDHYGMTEMGLGGGVECQAHAGYHLREADLYFEIIDPQTGQPVPEGQYGEVVFTTLTRKGMPLIRYRTGDLSRFIPEPCSCQTVIRRLEPVRARRTGNIQLSENHCLTMADLDEALFPLAGVVDFSASLSHRQGKMILQIAALLLGEIRKRQESALAEVLSQIPAIDAAQQTGSLALSLKLSQCADDITPKVAKRAITTLQGGILWTRK